MLFERTLSLIETEAKPQANEIVSLREMAAATLAAYQSALATQAQGVKI